MNITIFTVRDEKLIRGESARDPLGLMPIWRSLGHMLIPGLATIVSRIDGVQGILFLYSSLNSLPDRLRSKKTDGRILLFLERLWEFHLFRVNGNPCFGINKLNAEGFELNFNGHGTVGTGLRQYYRGTCRNKGILGNDLKTLLEQWKELADELLDKEFVVWLKGEAKNATDDNYHIVASEIYGQIEKHLKRFHDGNQKIWDQMEKELLQDAKQHLWIERILEKYPEGIDDTTVSTRQLVTDIQEIAVSLEAKDWAEDCQHFLDCEPFLQCMESCFMAMQELHRITINDFCEKLKNNSPGNLKEVAEQFCKLPGPSERLKTMKQIAEHWKNEHYKDAVKSLIEHYHKVCEERGNNPLVQLDGDKLLVNEPKNYDWKEWTESTNEWENGYFIKTQIELYKDIKGRQRMFNG